MDQDNSENINQLYTKYDLKTNYLYGVEMKSLKEFSLLRAVVHSFECDEALEEMRSWYRDQGQNKSHKLFKIVENNLQIQILPISLHKRVKLTIQLVYDEIKRFFELLFLKTDEPLFLGNFVFNWQGVINPLETFLQALERNEFSTQERFEFSCKFLFDEDKILIYFNKLTPNIQNYYRNISNYRDLGLYGFLICYWVRRSTEPLAEFQMIYLLELVNNYYPNSTYFVPNFCSEMGVQYLVENIAQDNVPLRLILAFLMGGEGYPVINILIYLLFQLRQDELFNTYCYMFFMELLINSMWYDNFMKYFRLLRNNLETIEYINVTYTAVLTIGPKAKIEGKIGKYFPILKEFITQIPIGIKAFMKDTEEQDYAERLIMNA